MTGDDFFFTGVFVQEDPSNEDTNQCWTSGPYNYTPFLSLIDHEEACTLMVSKVGALINDCTIDSIMFLT